MSLLSNFIASHVVTALEQELLSHAPELQDAFLNEIKEFSDVVSTWIQDKFAKKA